MDIAELEERITAAYQTYVDGRYRTCIVWRQRDGGRVEGLSDPFLLLTVRADATGTAGAFSGHPTEAAARTAAQEWLGSDRAVSLAQVPYSAMNWLFSTVTGHPLR